MQGYVHLAEKKIARIQFPPNTFFSWLTSGIAPPCRALLRRQYAGRVSSDVSRILSAAAKRDMAVSVDKPFKVPFGIDIISLFADVFVGATCSLTPEGIFSQQTPAALEPLL